MYPVKLDYLIYFRIGTMNHEQLMQPNNLEYWVK